MKGCESMSAISNFDEYYQIFEEEDFVSSAIHLFRTIGHTLTYKPYLIANDIKYCIYFDLGFKYIFTQQEEESFSYISQLSLLFQLEDNIFDIATHKSIKYYAIELSVSKSNRSNIAHTVHNSFSRESTNGTVILFRNDSECMLSISYGKGEDGNKIYLSDWINVNSDVEYIEKIDVQNLSFSSSLAFISDFIYYSAREYYIYQFSKEYIYNQILNLDFFRTDYRVDKEAVNRFIDEMLYGHIKLYGDDYIEEDEHNGNINNTNYDDLDLDMIELELESESDKKSQIDDFEEFDEMNDDSYEKDIDAYQVDIDEIDDYILNDPIELIKWLENNSS